MAAPVITSHKDQSIITISVATTVLVTAASDASVNLYYDGSLLGAMTNLGGGSFSYSWTPGSTAYGVKLLKATGNVTGDSASLRITVAEANRVPTIMSGGNWGVFNMTITAYATHGVLDPLGGTNAYRAAADSTATHNRYIFKAASVTPTSFEAALDIWVKPGALDVILIYPNEDGGVHYMYLDPVTGETAGVSMYGGIVERGANGWVRIQASFIDATTAGAKTWVIYCVKTILGGTSQAATAGDAIYFFNPRTADGQLPYYERQKILMYHDVAGDSGVQKSYRYKTRYMDAASDYGGSGAYKFFKIIFPTGYDPTARSYPIIWALSALSESTETAVGNTQMGTYLASIDLANTWNCIVAMPFCKGDGGCWWGRKANGTADNSFVVSDQLWDWVTTFLGVSTNPEWHLAIGYSKSWMGALSLKIRKPTKFGYAVGYDAPFDQDTTGWSANNAGTEFTDQATFRLYNPVSIIPANLSSLNDKKRIAIYGYNAFQSSESALTSILTSNSILYDYTSVSRSRHAWDTSPAWVASAVTAAHNMGWAASVSLGAISVEDTEIIGELIMKKNVAGQKIGAGMVTAADGSAFTGSVTVYITGDAGTQAQGSVGSGACTHEGNGYHTYAPSQAETNYDLIAFTFVGTGAVPKTVQATTDFPQTGDSFALIGSTGSGLTSLASAANLATVAGYIDTEVAAIKAKTDNLPSDPADASDIAASFSTVNSTLSTIAGYLDTEVAAIKAKTDNLPSDPADASDIAGRFNTVDTTLSTIAGYLDTEVAAIKAKTDNLPTDPADASDITNQFNTVNSTLSTLAGYVDTEVAAIKAKTDNLPAAPAAVGDIPTATQIADETLSRDLSAVTAPNRYSLINAARGIVNKAVISGGNLTVYEEDGTTIAFTATIVTSASADPITSITPA